MKKKRHFKIRYIIFGFLIVVLFSSIVFMYFGGFSTGEVANIDEFKECAQPVENLSIPKDKKIIALGEATHGNSEFQQLKLDVFKKMVEDYDVRAFVIEGDYGGCEQVNQYIHGGEGTAQEAAAAIGFVIYQTDEMAELISYMREYNKSALEGEDIRFYGFDMQRISYNFQFLLEGCMEFKIDTTSLEELVEGDNLNPSYDFSTQVEVLSQVKSELRNSGASDKTIHYADMLLQYCELHSISTSDGSVLRLTVSEYYTPNEVKIHKLGIEPDVVVELQKDGNEDSQLKKAIEILNEK